jgi:hypothetical protein
MCTISLSFFLSIVRDTTNCSTPQMSPSLEALFGPEVHCSPWDSIVDTMCGMKGSRRGLSRHHALTPIATTEREGAEARALLTSTSDSTLAAPLSVSISAPSAPSPLAATAGGLSVMATRGRTAEGLGLGESDGPSRLGGPPMDLKELLISKGLLCPYCDKEWTNAEAGARHIASMVCVKGKERSEQKRAEASSIVTKFVCRHCAASFLSKKGMEQHFVKKCRRAYYKTAAGIAEKAHRAMVARKRAEERGKGKGREAVLDPVARGCDAAGGEDEGESDFSEGGGVG